MPQLLFTFQKFIKVQRKESYSVPLRTSTDTMISTKAIRTGINDKRERVL